MNRINLIPELRRRRQLLKRRLRMTVRIAILLVLLLLVVCVAVHTSAQPHCWVPPAACHHC